MRTSTTSTAVVPARGTLADLAKEIRDECDAAAQSLRKGIDHALSAGRLLLEAKSQCSHGSWLPWLEENVPDVTVRQAQKYMRLAENWPRPSANTHPDSYLSIDEALTAIATPVGDEDAASAERSDVWEAPAPPRIYAGSGAAEVEQSRSVPVSVTTDRDGPPRPLTVSVVTEEYPLAPALTREAIRAARAPGPRATNDYRPTDGDLPGEVRVAMLNTLASVVDRVMALHEITAALRSEPLARAQFAHRLDEAADGFRAVSQRLAELSRATLQTPPARPNPARGHGQKAKPSKTRKRRES
jgi:hypothetical protein